MNKKAILQFVASIKGRLVKRPDVVTYYQWLDGTIDKGWWTNVGTPRVKQFIKYGLSRRTAGALVANNFLRPSDIMERCPTPKQLMLVKGIGKKSVQEIAAMLWELRFIQPSPQPYDLEE